ncbi:hypothetical protein [Cupriavidus necator]|uniref:hypothetical protein n=1 Tax=Cupriavidus necator TaxID=106590 RepID=UPI000AF924F6|nr:hypothetical protein [Cupriavidus necator]
MSLLRNPYKVLLGLLPDPPLQVGTVLSISNGVATVQLPGGGLLQARGATSQGATVFVRDGVIEGAAPSLPVQVIDV